MGKVVPLATGKSTSAEPLVLENQNDDELMLLTRGGKIQAFDVLVHRHQAMVVRIAHKYLNDMSDAKDVVQNSFMELFRYRYNYQARGKFVSFLYRIAINQCRMKMRSRNCETKALAKYATLQQSQENLPVHYLLAQEERREVERALRQLSPKLKEVLILRFMAELSYKEIADTLSIRLGTVKSRIFSGLDKMLQLMETNTK
ncbi:MAG: RNA polymerase sigma factor [Myxococcota bacterium]|nr:RNA polymerase sigma factor [Myxococcota bacterium]